MRAGFVVSFIAALTGWALLLYIAGPVILACVAVFCIIVSVAIFVHATHGPLTEDELELARRHDEMEHHEERARRRVERQESRLDYRPGGGWRAR